jgi:hypothetical protein
MTIEINSVTVTINGKPYVVEAKSDPSVFRVRKWGDPIMVEEGGFSTNNIGGTNFQAVGLYNKAHDSTGGVSNFLRIPHAYVMKLAMMQLEDDFVDKQPGYNKTYKMESWRVQKMNWLVKDMGTIYFWFHHLNSGTWNAIDYAEWGTIALGNNFVQVLDIETLTVPGTDKRIRGRRTRKMCKLAGFMREDWDRPLQELLWLGLVHRCYCAYAGNKLGDTPKGICYSPFWSPLDWQFIGPAQAQPEAFYIPEDWLIK